MGRRRRRLDYSRTERKGIDIRTVGGKYVKRPREERMKGPRRKEKGT